LLVDLIDGDDREDRTVLLLLRLIGAGRKQAFAEEPEDGGPAVGLGRQEAAEGDGVDQ
jgi:hypothetical protein